MALTPRIRFQVLQRDGFACCYCGARAPVANLHVDHIVPRSKGGSDSLENLQAACDKCNHGKAARNLVAIDSEADAVDPIQALTGYCTEVADVALELLHLIWVGERPTEEVYGRLAESAVAAWSAAVLYGDMAPEHRLYGPYRAACESEEIARARDEHGQGSNG